MDVAIVTSSIGLRTPEFAILAVAILDFWTQKWPEVTIFEEGGVGEEQG